LQQATEAALQQALAAWLPEARALVGFARARLLPEAGANASRARSLSSSATGLLPPGMPRERNDYRATLEVSYEIDLWGRLRNAAEAARAAVAALARTAEVTTLADIEATDVQRTPTGHGELDRVLGGGIVEGGVVLIGGDPGIGKSTLLLQALDSLQRSWQKTLSDAGPPQGAKAPSGGSGPRAAGERGGGTLYVTGEESLSQVAGRAQRLGLGINGVSALAETCVERILSQVSQAKPRLMVADSIQTLWSELLTAAPGSVSQVRESAAKLVRFAKETGTAVFLVGHVTKDGSIAGPRVLEHMVDVVLQFEEFGVFALDVPKKPAADRQHRRDDEADHQPDDELLRAYCNLRSEIQR